jgi:hypothetical protein
MPLSKLFSLFEIVGMPRVREGGSGQPAPEVRGLVWRALCDFCGRETAGDIGCGSAICAMIGAL